VHLLGLRTPRNQLLNPVTQARAHPDPAITQRCLTCAPTPNDDHVSHLGPGASGLRTYLYPPQQIVVGEVRQQESLDLLIALNSGIPGMCTIHANSARCARSSPYRAGSRAMWSNWSRSSPCAVSGAVAAAADPGDAWLRLDVAVRAGSGPRAVHGDADARRCPRPARRSFASGWGWHDRAHLAAAPRQPRITAAGYGWAHQQQARASWGPLVATGKVRCAPSGEPIQPREHRRNSHDHHR